MIVLVRQIRQVFAQLGKTGTIANGGTIFGNEGKDKITRGIGYSEPSEKLLLHQVIDFYFVMQPKIGGLWSRDTVSVRVV